MCFMEFLLQVRGTRDHQFGSLLPGNWGLKLWIAPAEISSSTFVACVHVTSYATLFTHHCLNHRYFAKPGSYTSLFSKLCLVYLSSPNSHHSRSRSALQVGDFPNLDPQRPFSLLWMPPFEHLPSKQYLLRKKAHLFNQGSLLAELLCNTQ